MYIDTSFNHCFCLILGKFPVLIYPPKQRKINVGIVNAFESPRGITRNVRARLRDTGTLYACMRQCSFTCEWHTREPLACPPTTLHYPLWLLPSDPLCQNKGATFQRPDCLLQEVTGLITVSVCLWGCYGATI